MEQFFDKFGEFFRLLAAAAGGGIAALTANEALMGFVQLLLGTFSRYLLPVLALLLLVRCTRSLFHSRMEQETWGHLVLTDGERLPLNHWENLVGRSARSDVVLPYRTVSRSHAALIRNSRGRWTLYALNSKNGVLRNGEMVISSAPLAARDILTFGDVETCFLPYTSEEERSQAQRRVRPGKNYSPSVTTLLMTLFDVALWYPLWVQAEPDMKNLVTVAFVGLVWLMWVLYLTYRVFRRTGFELETLAFFLSSLCLAITASTAPAGLMKQLVSIALGLGCFFGLSLCLRSLELVKKLRRPLAIGSMVLLALNLVLAAVHFGAKNWLNIGGVSFQSSEFVKIAFILAGATTLDRMFSRKNLIYTLIYSAYCVGCLGLMSDFGTALIFFVAFLAITFLRSGDLASVLLMVLAAASAGYIVLQFKSYILARFAVYRHVWDDPSNLGYQQTRTMSAIANGGLFGKGVGAGWLKNVGAANTDLVFGVIAEEMGLILAVTAVAAIVVMALFAVREASAARSSFYVITACSAAMIFVVQAMLNVFGSTDILPLTGVTLPFVSVGGSSMISCWALLAFIKASDTRQNAALSVRLPKARKKGQPEEPESWRTATGFFARPQSEPERADEKSATVRFRSLFGTGPLPPLRDNTGRVPPVDEYTSPVPPMNQNTGRVPQVDEHTRRVGRSAYPGSDAAPARPAEQAEDNSPLPPLDVPEGSSDADNWRDYFLRDEDWGDQP